MFVSTKQIRIATLARNNRAMAFTSLNQYMDYNWLLQAYQLTRKDGATGVDGQTAEMYERQLESNLLNLLDRLKSGQYRAPVLRRVYIPKGKGQKRSLGIPTFEKNRGQVFLCAYPVTSITSDCRNFFDYFPIILRCFLQVRE